MEKRKKWKRYKNTTDSIMLHAFKNLRKELKSIFAKMA